LKKKLPLPAAFFVKCYFINQNWYFPEIDHYSEKFIPVKKVAPGMGYPN
jgi:hypothetical protein